MTVTVRPARIDEADRLGDLCRRSKQHWGYDAAFMAQCHDSLAVNGAAIAAGRVWVAVGADDRPLAVVQIEPAGESIDLDKLFVEPSQIGRGLGRLLLQQAVAAARAQGFREMTILADPQAADFYRRQGAEFLRMAPSDAVAGRLLPLFVLRL